MKLNHSCGHTSNKRVPTRHERAVYKAALESQSCPDCVRSAMPQELRDLLDRNKAERKRNRRLCGFLNRIAEIELAD